MSYGRYFVFDVAGGILWVGSMILAGYFLGSVIPNVNERIHYIIGAVIFLSLLPAIISVRSQRGQS
jgi:membrane-associated protein